MTYTVDDKTLSAEEFTAFANTVWPGNYNVERTREALSRTINITARDDGRLVGCLRILTDGYYFGTITEMLVAPDRQKQGVGSELLRLARENTPTMLYFGAQPGVEGFYERNGCAKSLQSYELNAGRSGLK